MMELVISIPKFGEKFRFRDYEMLSDIRDLNKAIQEEAVAIAKRWDDAIVDAIVKEAHDAGYAEVTVLNGPEIREAIRRYFKPETNADLIRAMSDEQLEAFLIDVELDKGTLPFVSEWGDWLRRHPAAGDAPVFKNYDNAVVKIVTKDEGCEWCEPGHEACGTCERFFSGLATGCATESTDKKCAAYVPADHCMKCGRSLRSPAGTNQKG